jgi:hypothetical protein
MKKPLLAGLALFSASAAFAQSSVTINQSGASANRAVVSQSGSNNSVVINQNGNAIETTDHDSDKKDPSDSEKPGVGNQVSLRVDKNAQTTINQHNTGPNSVELWQDGSSQATINQSSGTNENSISTHPSATPQPKSGRAGKRRKRD